MPKTTNKVFKKRKRVCNVNLKHTQNNNAKELLDLAVGQTSSRILPSKLSVRNESSSKKKVGPKLCLYEQYEVADDSCNDIVNLQKLENLLAKIAVCEKCGGRVVLNRSHRLGLSLKITIRCINCGFEVSEYNSSKISETKINEANTMLAYGFRCIGKGEALNLPIPPAMKYYYTIMCKAAKEVSCETMNEAVEETVNENEGNRDITATFDGSWQRRGHRFLNGIVTAKSGTNGKVLDVRIFTKHCRCVYRLKEEHEPNCRANFQGSSGSMEVKGVTDMFKSSVTKNNIRYKYYLGDGDSAAFPTVVESKPYGPSFIIEKLECVGHVQKRMGARLQKFKTKKGKDKLSDDKTIGGRGRLTDSAIKQIQLYYGFAIRRHTSSLEEMK